MQRIIQNLGSRYKVVNDFRADVKQLTQPKLKEHVTIKGGQMFYNGVNNELYRADLFDRYFKVKRLKEE